MTTVSGGWRSVEVMEDVNVGKEAQPKPDEKRYQENQLLEFFNGDRIVFDFFFFIRFVFFIVASRPPTSPKEQGLDQDPQEEGVAIEAQKKASQWRPHLFFLFVRLQRRERQRGTKTNDSRDCLLVRSREYLLLQEDGDESFNAVEMSIQHQNDRLRRIEGQLLPVRTALRPRTSITYIMPSQASHA
ncbi:hypothetical protein Syun_010541 [Stephania yunnanensis]|uniref:Uncharacterized protein n=1 Tax=Stephania yunnanensis TaxID=152371 RepID=A0AAP0KGP8_9MAGN